jgi:hypothetical protein
MISLNKSPQKSGDDFNRLRQTCGFVRISASNPYASRKACIRSTHGAVALVHIRSLRRFSQTRSQDQRLLLLGSIPGHSLCAVDMARVIARHRSQSQSAGQAAVSHGLSLRHRLAQHHLQRQCLFVITQAHAFFVIRAKSNMKFKRRYSHEVDRAATSVLYDQTGVQAIKVPKTIHRHCAGWWFETRRASG